MMVFTTDKIWNPVISVFLFVLISLITGCAPSVRYTRNSSPIEERTEHLYGQSDSLETMSVLPDRLLETIASYIGTPYRFGGTDRRGLDCSGFVSCVFSDALDVKLPHNSFEMHELGRSVPVRRARGGDLVFFWGSRRGIDHVGIYIGQGRFAHSSTTRGVIYSDLSDNYYEKHFAGMRRIFK